MADNPYQSPVADVSAVRPMLATGGISEKSLSYIKSTTPWMRFLGIMGFIACGFLVAFGLFFVTLPAVFMKLQHLMDADTVAGLGILGVLGGIVYIVLAVVFFFPALWLYKAGSRYRTYIRTGSDLDLEEALRYNKSFWKFLGISVIVQLALIPVGIVITTVAAIGNAFL